MSAERIDKLLASTGRWSRKEVRELVRRGQVLAGGVPVVRPEEKYDPAHTAFQVQGEPVDCAPYVYVMLHKPAGVLTATEDRRQRTVLELLPDHLRRRGLSPVGRLDKDTTGLLLLTTDRWPTGCCPPGTTWTRYTWPRWRGALTRLTWMPWRRAWCWRTGCSACPPGWSRWGTAPPAWSRCMRASTTR